MRIFLILGLVALSGLTACAGQEVAEAEAPVAEAATEQVADQSTWAVGGTIASGLDGVADLEILKVHSNGAGEVCGVGRTATLKYKAMLANGKVLDPGNRPFSFEVGSGRAIKGWDVIVSKMRVGDSFTITLPKELAYGPSKGDLMFDMELLSVR